MKIPARTYTRLVDSLQEEFATGHSHATSDTHVHSHGGGGGAVAVGPMLKFSSWSVGVISMAAVGMVH